MPPVKAGSSTAYLGFENVLDTVLNVGLENVRLGELLVPVRGQPDPGQGALLGQHKVRVEHAGAVFHSTSYSFSSLLLLLCKTKDTVILSLGVDFTPLPRL